MKALRALGFAVWFLAAACGSAHQRQAAGPALTAPSAPWPHPRAVPTQQELEAAPACVREIAALRQCHLEMRRTAVGSYSCPEGLRADAWTAKNNASGVFVPSDLSRGFDDAIRCGIRPTEVSTENIERLEAAGFHLGAAYSVVIFGSLPLSHAFCVAELDVVVKMECDKPSHR